MPDIFNYRYRLLDIDLSAVLTDFVYPIQGERIYYEGPSDGPELTVKLQAAQNDGIRLRPQGEIVGPFTRLYVSGPVSGLVPRLIVSSPKEISLTSRDVNVGTINTLSTITNPVPVGNVASLTTITNPVISKQFLLDRAQAGTIFERVALVAAVAATYGHVQVWNPVASGKTVVVSQAHIVEDTGSRVFELMQYNTALTTLVGTFFNVANGGSNSTAELRSQTNGAALGTNMLRKFSTPGIGTIMDDRFDVLSPGEGLLIRPTVQNIGLNIAYRIWEF